MSDDDEGMAWSGGSGDDDDEGGDGLLESELDSRSRASDDMASDDGDGEDAAGLLSRRDAERSAYKVSLPALWRVFLETGGGGRHARAAGAAEPCLSRRTPSRHIAPRGSFSLHARRR